MSDQAASTEATVHAVTLSHRTDERVSVSRPSDGVTSKTRLKTKESRSSNEKTAHRQKDAPKSEQITGTEQGISQAGGQDRRNRYYTDRPRYQRGARASRTDSCRSDQERPYRNPGHRPDLKHDNPPLSSQSLHKDGDKKSVDPQDQPKAACQPRSKSKTERPSGETQKNARPPPRHKQDAANGGQSRNTRQHGKKTASNRDNTSDKIDIDNKASKSIAAVKETLDVEASSKPRSRSTAKNTERYNYTKPKPEKQQNRGQRSAPTVQSDQLTQELTAETYECMVCYECVRGGHHVWSCEGCYHVFHLKCIKKWASAPVLLDIDRGVCLFCFCIICDMLQLQCPWPHRQT